MAYEDDAYRAQKHTLPKSPIGMSTREMLLQKKMLQDMIKNNKRVMAKGVQSENEKAEEIAREGLKRFETKTGINQADADKKMQEVVDYYK